MQNDKNPAIRPAGERDLSRVGELLLQVNEVHHTIRPDLFKTQSRKYNDAELRAVFAGRHCVECVCLVHIREAVFTQPRKRVDVSCNLFHVRYYTIFQHWPQARVADIPRQPLCHRQVSTL